MPWRDERIQHRATMKFRLLSLAVLSWIFSAAINLAADASALAQKSPPRTPVPAERMAAVYDELKTPYKWGPVLSGPGGSRVDNPRVFRMHDTWFMTYNHVEGAGGYEVQLAVLAGAAAGKVNVSLDGAPLAATMDAHAANPTRREFDLGVVKVAKAGPHTMTLTVESPATAGGEGEWILDSMDWRKR